MTICIGLIPNEKTVMLMQDSEISYEGVGFTQDIVNKIKRIDNHSIVGVIGIPIIANEVLAYVARKQYRQAKEIRDVLEEAYHTVREEKLHKGLLRKYGFKHIREITQPAKETNIDPSVREEALRFAGNENRSFNLSLMLATNLECPQLYSIDFPGCGHLENNAKMYSVRGSGSIMAIDKMGEELDKYKWQRELSIDEGIEVLLRAGKASEKHQGVGGPFDITYVTNSEDGKSKVVKPDQKKINMVMYLFPLGIDEKTMLEAIIRMRDEHVSAEELAAYIKSNTKVGMEFDNYFRL